MTPTSRPHLWNGRDDNGGVMLRRHMPDVAFALLCTIADPSLLLRLGAVGEHPWG